MFALSVLLDAVDVLNIHVLISLNGSKDFLTQLPPMSGHLASPSLKLLNTASRSERKAIVLMPDIT